MRSVSYEPLFDEKLRAIQPDFERADAFIQGVEWLLSRKPEAGTQIGGTAVWCIPAADVFVKPLMIFYTFTATKVHMLSIEATELPDEPL